MSALLCLRGLFLGLLLLCRLGADVLEEMLSKFFNLVGV